MTWTTFHLQVSTPLFSGDDATSTGSPIRVPSIRGALRFWFRAVAAGHDITDLTQLAEQETEVFGSTNHPSPIRLRVSRAVDPRFVFTEGQPTWASHSEDGSFFGARYLLGQGLWDRQSGLRPYVEPGATFELQVRFCADHGVNHRFMAALRAWLIYGGLGARTRRGFGRLKCTGITDLPVPDWTVELLNLNGDVKRITEQWIDPIPDDVWVLTEKAFPAPTGEKPLLAQFPSFGSGDWEGQPLSSNTFPIDVALDQIGRQWRRFRAHQQSTDPLGQGSPEWENTIVGPGSDYPVAAFGLPVNYYRPKDNNRPAIEATVDVVSASEPQRRASPVWLVPFAINDTHYALFTHVFRAELLPAEQPPAKWELRLKGGTGPKTLTAPGEDSLRQSWDAWLDLTKSRPTPASDKDS